jgi:N-carbamoyl-L-amino-acid hydrolase
MGDSPELRRAETLLDDLRRQPLYDMPGRDHARPRIIMGSHMDAVPHGGNYDGVAGVVAGLGAIEQLRRRSVTPTMDVTAMAICAEGVSWFPAPYIGSPAAFGILPEDVLDSVVRLRIDGMKRLASCLTWWHMVPHKSTPQSTPQKNPATRSGFFLIAICG